MSSQAILEPPERKQPPPRPHTAELVYAAQSGDRDAFGQLVERYQGLVHTVIRRRIGDHAENEELAQDVFVQAMRKLDQLRDPRCFGGWLRSIAARTAVNWAVRRKPCVTGEPEAYEAACVNHDTPLREALSAERAECVRSGLRRLGSLDRRTLEAFYFDGRSLLEMSADFDSPVGTIKRRLHVARKRLAAELSALALA